ncbi:hypothetical protein E2C01_001033 [Portunus trituberculatus]|uniref:Uncharacterized protein n=1 Tax=Portunus trituberculatus TaxID=210409 RepID=A0A5B7CG68_PORTR|nr:hypothetical protein [Portunus trituberculatus]
MSVSEKGFHSKSAIAAELVVDGERLLAIQASALGSRLANANVNKQEAAPQLTVPLSAETIFLLVTRFIESLLRLFPSFFCHSVYFN